MRLSVLLLILLFFFTSGLLAQSTPNLFPVYDSKSMTPTSPEAAMLGRFGDIPVGYYTGTADISIPLYTIKEDGMELPIVLRYQGSGIKVADQAGNVGLGWSMEPEGTIIQVVNGSDDAYDRLVSADSTGYAFLSSRKLLGQYSATTDIGTNDWSCAPPYNGSEDSYTTLLRLLAGDGQPDIYNYNFGGHSGKFFVNYETGLPVLIDKKEEIRFQREYVNSQATWKATTIDGDVYHFNVFENTSSYNSSYNPSNAHTGYTFKLTRVDLHTGKTVQYQYANGFYKYDTYSERYHPAYPFGLNPAEENGIQKVTDYISCNTLNLVGIQSSEVMVRFNLEDRNDLMGEADIDTIAGNGVVSTKRIRSVDIYSSVSGKKLRTFRFFYSYFPYSTVGGSFIDTTGNSNAFGSRLKLDSLQEIGYSPAGDSLAKPSYKFAYNNSTVLPMKTSYAQDFWGYYNGKSNSSLLPDMSFFYYNMDSNYVGVPANLMDSTFTADRAPDSVAMTAAMLQRLTYPTGGYTEFDYTPHSFSNHYYPDHNKVTATLKQLSVADQNLTPYPVVSFTLSRKTIVSFNVRMFCGYPQPTEYFTAFQPSWVMLQKYNPSTGTTTLKTWQMMAADSNTWNADGKSIQWLQDITIPYDPTPGTIYTVTTNLNDALGAQNTSQKTAEVVCNIKYYDTIGAKMQRSLGGGVRLSGIRNYTDSGNLASHKVIRYINTDSSSSGLLMSPILYWHYTPTTFIKNISSDVIDEIIGDSAWYITSESAVPFSSSAGGQIVGYSRVEEWEVAPDGTNNGVHIFEYNNTPDSYNINCPDDPHLTNSLVNRETVVKSSGDTVQQTTYNYQILHSADFNGIKIFTTYYGPSPCDVGGTDGDGTGTDGWSDAQWPLNNRYLIMFYPVNSFWYVQSQKVSRYYGSGKILSDTTNIAYNTLGQVNNTQSKDSKGQLLNTRIVYPVDSGYTNIDSTTWATGWYALPYFKQQLVNGNEIQRVIIYYSNGPAGFPVMNTNWMAYKGGSPFMDVSFDGYGINDNVTHYIQRGSPVGVLWNRNNTQVIANVKNGRKGAYAYTSFEQDESASWNISDTARNYSTSITGDLSYTFSGSSQITDSVSAGTYVLSYWSRSGALTVSNGSTNFSGQAGPVRNGWTYYEHTVTSSGGAVRLTGSGITIDELRLFEPTAEMKTFTYRPLVGITSECDPANRIFYYVYDALSRLTLVKDQDGNVTKTIDYHYKGQ